MSYVDFKVFQPNPKKRRTYDCNLRALCAVSGFSWLQMYDKMSEVARSMYLNTEDDKVAIKILEKWGFKKQVIKINKGDVRPTVYDIGVKYGYCDYIVCKIAGGFVSIVRGCLLDTYDLRYSHKVYTCYIRGEMFNPYL